MPEVTETRVVRPTEDQVQKSRTRLAGARQTRDDKIAQAERDKEQANKDFLDAVATERDKRTPWKDIEETAGMARQTLSEMLKERG